MWLFSSAAKHAVYLEMLFCFLWLQQQMQMPDQPDTWQQLNPCSHVAIIKTTC